MRPALCGYLETLDEAAFGAASEVQPEFTRTKV